MIEPYEGKDRTKKSQILEGVRSLECNISLFWPPVEKRATLVKVVERRLPT